MAATGRDTGTGILEWIPHWQLSSGKIRKLTLFGIGEAGTNQHVAAEVASHWMRRQD
ncbi:hypothetical protein [Neoaquamicrobium microcysteis]|uniref:hypothetical protein n=1 Tax=Neoaquamicrobium microcysteis TaxID=2682781 RepID=UPI001375A967|nr:hypothetical protein [Mesorhizobium microcysteis]